MSAEDSPSSLLRLRLTSSSSWIALFKVFAFSLVGRVFVFVFSCSNGLLTSLLCLNSYGPDKAQQFTGYCRHDLPVILAGHGQFPVTLVQAILCLPCDFGNLCRNPLLSFTQLGSDAGPVSIAPGRFHHDASEVRVAGLGDAALSLALATGVFAGKYSAIPHQLACAS